LLLRETIENQSLIKEDKNLLTELVYGVLQRKYTLDYQLETFIKKQKKMQNWVKQLLRLSLYQIEYLERIPDHAIVNEAVNIAKIRGHKGIASLVNGVLRNVLRKGVRDPKEIKNKHQQVSIQYSLPIWLVKEFIEELGLEETIKLAASFNERPKLSLRVNTNRISREDAIKDLKEEGYETKKSQISPFGIIALNGVPAESTLFKKGLISVQDESSMLVAPTLNVSANDYVLDACAAPGGKTMHIASNFLSAEAGGKIQSLDVHQHKINLIYQNAKRLGLKELVQAKKMDARNVLDDFAEKTFDRILVDAPCSGLGLIRRRPEIRYNKTKKDIHQLQELQLEIMNEVSKTLKENGELVYSTCTLTKHENQSLVKKFLKENKEFEQIDVKLPTDTLQLDEDGSITIYPHQHQTDGFFISRFKKKA
ncbi:MAG: 16S rRNA (cytosine(967)-C(5))-methyltransferase RsmB, partial [Atopostipes suicloacalis]|nr:16S rRNA (cytosine(967)-C(5))-methyltransferase RsmB [Atopostipes suicloacalis]